MKINFILPALVILSCFIKIHAQEGVLEDIGDDVDAGLTEDVDRIGPGLASDPPPKVVVVRYERTGHTILTSTSDNPELGDTTAQVNMVNEFRVKVKAPLWIKDNTNILYGFAYSYQEYKFDDPNDLTYSLYQNIENKHLKIIENNIYFNHYLTRRRFVVAKLGTSFNGDYSKDDLPLVRYLKVTFSASYGFRRRDDLAWGIALYYNYSFGRQSIYPAILYKRAFNNNFGVEALFPGKINFYYSAWRGNFFNAGYTLEGASYRIQIDSAPLNQFRSLELRRSDISPYFAFEQQIYDFIWFNITAGYRFNINFNVDRDNRISTERLIHNTIKPTPYLSASLFLTIPKKFRR